MCGKLVLAGVLPERAEPLPGLLELYKVCLGLEFLCRREKGAGLSAFQAGLPYPVFVVRFGDGFRYFADCAYRPAGPERDKSLEACLSVRRADGGLRFFEVERFRSVVVSGRELTADPEIALEDVEFEPEGNHQSVFQHEIDHSSGLLISSIGKELEIWEK